MAEFVEKRLQDMIPALEQMEKLKLFDKNEIKSITKKLGDYEYKIQRHTKCKEDYLRYIQYQMDLLKLVKQRQDKHGITLKTSDIEHRITNKMNKLYQDAIFKFQDDIRFWIAYMKFCKHVHFQGNINTILGRVLQVHRDKPKFWHIAAYWELEENNDKEKARHYLLRGLQTHPDSQLLYIDSFKFELNNPLDSAPSNENTENQENNSVTDDSKIPRPLKPAFFVYQQAFDRIKDIKFIIELLNITNDYNNIEPLQKRMICDMIQEYSHEPLMWDTMARRELQGLVQPDFSGTPMEIDAEQITLRDRISSCTAVYQAAVKTIKSEEIWSLYIECLLEINRDLRSLPNFKRKLLKTALMQAHQMKKLKEEHYLHWIDMLNVDKEHNEDVRKKLDEVLRGATDALPNSVSIWHARLKYLLQCGLEEEAYAMFPKVTKILSEKALPLWKMRILHAQIKSSEKAEESFKAALAQPSIAKDIQPMWLEWLILAKDIRAARKAYGHLCQSTTSLELHKEMIKLEFLQPEIQPKYVRQSYENATRQYGTNNTTIWLEYIKFEKKYGDAMKISDIYERAIRTLDRSLTYSFMADHSLITAH